MSEKENQQLQMTYWAGGASRISGCVLGNFEDGHPDRLIHLNSHTYSIARLFPNTQYNPQIQKT